MTHSLPRISMIAAMANHRVIGKKDGGIPWKLPRDSKHFRDYTAGKFMLLGRTTFEEMDGWFTTQTPIVLTRRPDYKASGALVGNSMEEVIQLAQKNAADELVVSGGAEIYQAALPFADELFLTLVDAEFEGGRFFPDYEAEAKWEEISREHFDADSENEYAITFVTLRRLV